MNRVYLSFLGLGSNKNGRFAYDPATYELNGIFSKITEFVQVAEIEILKPESFDKIIIVTTQKASDTHSQTLKSELSCKGACNIFDLIISEDMSPKGQWGWFEKILDSIDHGDELTVDLTHGYRSVPIIFSTAINFLRKAKNIKLNAVYYGVFEKVKEHGYAPIIDMKDFYVINEWAEAVSRLIEDADARKLAEISEQTTDFQVGELNDPEIGRAFDELTGVVRNVDINNVSKKADQAICLLKEKEKTASVTGRILLRLVMDKFLSLTTEAPLSGKYEKAYFEVQLEIIRMVLEHKLFMQAYTVMREYIGSIGMLGIDKASIGNSEGRKRRSRYAEVFISMLQFPEGEWRFDEVEEKRKPKDKLIPFYEKLKVIGVESILRDFTKALVDYRNGFDHAWTSKDAAYKDIRERGTSFYNRLVEVTSLIFQSKTLG